MAAMLAEQEVTLSIIILASDLCHRVPALAALVTDLAGMLPCTPCELVIVAERGDSELDGLPALSHLDAAAGVRRVRMVRCEPPDHLRGRVGAIQCAVAAARGPFIGVIEPGWSGATVLLPELLAVCQVADLAVATRRSEARAWPTLVAHAVFTRTRACNDPFSGLFVSRRAVLESAPSISLGDEPLLSLLVCGDWSRLAEVSCPAAVAAELPALVASAPMNLVYLATTFWRLARARRRPIGRVRRVDPMTGASRSEEREPLDTDLPDARRAGPRRLRLLWQFVLIALVLRLALLPLGHPWDTTTFYNMFVDLGHDRSPYDAARELTGIARSAGWGLAYEGYAYPPGPLYLYYPLARLFVWLHPALTTHFAVQGRLAVPSMPLDFYLWLKLPFWLGDLGIAAVLWRMTNSTRSFRDYLLNPYVLLVSGCWTFDSVMVLSLLLGVYWLQRGRLSWSAAVLAFGTMVKYVPALTVPTCALYLIQRKRPLSEVLLFLGAYSAGCALMIGPFLNGVLDVLSFQGARPGGGMHWEMIFEIKNVLPRAVDWHAVAVAVSSYSMVIFVLAMLLAYRYVFLREMPLYRMILVTLLVYLLATKLVNEQYVLAIWPFSFIELYANRGRWVGWRPVHHLLWITPLVFAAMNVPIDRFLLPLYVTVFGPRANLVIGTGGDTALSYDFLPWHAEPFGWYALDALALWFMALVLGALIWLARHPVPLGKRPVQPIYASTALAGVGAATAGAASVTAQPGLAPDASPGTAQAPHPDAVTWMPAGLELATGESQT